MARTDERAAQPRRISRYGGGLAWKSSLVASSLGAVLLGWALLAQADSAAATAGPEQMANPAPRVIVVQASVPAPPVPDLPQLEGQTGPAQTAPVTSAPVAVESPRLLPALPERPIFQQPVTRSRAS